MYTSDKDVPDVVNPYNDGKVTYDASTTGSRDAESARDIQNSHTVHVIDHHAERALCRKFDLRLLPVLACMYLFNALDKGNLGNAKTAGLERDLHFENNQYNVLLSVFYVPYVIFAPPIGMLGKKFGPSRVLPIMMCCFGIFTVLGIAAKNFAGMMVLRWFLGMSESAFFPLVIYYQTTFYRRGELARRLAIFYAASNIASAFSGLLSFGVFQIDSGPLYSWRYLFLIEGTATILFSLFAYWYLPGSAATARFLSPSERALAFHRIQVDSSSTVNEPFNLRDSLKIFLMPATYGFLCIEICLGVPLQSVTLFLPQIVSELGYNTVKTNLYTVAPNISGAIVLLILAFSSDYIRLRSPFIVLGFLFTFTGFLIYLSIDVASQIRVAYFATFMMTWGTSAPSVLLSTWYNNNVAHEGRRVVLTSVGVPLANLMGVVSSNIFQNKDAPKYIPALATTAAFGATGALLTGLLGVYMALDNAKRDRRLGRVLGAKDVPTERLRDGPSVEEFRWFL
ncbi:hypothetical protein MMC24_004070 [Lignoscripta atroalba]|nr:hypothetical protein [Lignoscripta atroalba]